MIDKYIESGEFDRTQLALDIKNGKLNYENVSAVIKEIDEAISSNKIDNPYIGEGYKAKRKKSEWNKRYLDYLVAEISSSEVFNIESIKYLTKVAFYVNSATKRMLKKIGLVFIGLCALFCAGVITGKSNFSNNSKWDAEIEKLQNELTQLQDSNSALIKQLDVEKTKNEELQKENNALHDYVNQIKSVIDKVHTREEDVSSKDKSPDELDIFINRALSGENVKKEFNAQNKYGSADVEKRALEKGLKRGDAQKLIDNLANPKKFNINKFQE